ncbi:hypothetical protein LCGC14_0496930 [marine sediment metagenome]|uniref:Uncharacterized protein n=1 Tax=marine sediment metagenome TaxID=412755 RepID=A0A0F9S4Z9_9ZZZZ
MEIGEIRVLFDNLKWEIYSKLKNNKQYDEFKHFYQYSKSHLYYSWTYQKEPNIQLNIIRKEMEKEFEEDKERRLQEMFSNQAGLYRKWI